LIAWPRERHESERGRYGCRVALRAVIFDLDDTLLDTRALFGLREQRLWRQAYENLHRAVPFDVPDGESPVVSLPAEARARGLRVGLLTHSPEPYARELLGRSGIAVDAMITGSAGYPPKPDPTGLRAVMNTLGVSPDEVIYVGDSAADFAAAAAAGAISVGVAWNGNAPPLWRHSWPDFGFSRPSRLIALFDGEEGLGPLASVCAAGEAPNAHWGSVLRVGGGVLALGRYFRTDDRRHPAHALSGLVLRAKSDPPAADEVAGIFKSFAEAVPVTQPPDLVLSVPPAPDQDYDRFAAVRPALASAWSADSQGGETLRMCRAVSDYKQLPHEQRATANIGRFEARALSGERIVLIDDVLTSGSQADACRTALNAAGADTVTVLALAITQENLPEPCPNCGANLRLLHRHRDGKPFLGCSAWRITGCPYTRGL
jgi:HAD superfamily hydrolase (TIGR01509 family)